MIQVRTRAGRGALVTALLLPTTLALTGIAVDETFNLVLSAANGGTVSGASGTATIVNVD